MKYIILNDLTYIFTKKYKIMLLYLLTLILFFYGIKDGFYEDIIQVVMNDVLVTRISYKLLLSNPFATGMILVNYGLIIYFSILIYIKDMENYDNFYFRMSVLKWIFSKIITTFILCFIINFIIYFTVFLNNFLGLKLFIILIKKIIVLLFIIMIIYLVLLFFKKLKILSIILLIGLLSFILIGYDIQKMNMFYSILLFGVSLIFLIIASKNIKFSDLKG